jgi:hypothetical protein
VTSQIKNIMQVASKRLSEASLEAVLGEMTSASHCLTYWSLKTVLKYSPWYVCVLNFINTVTCLGGFGLVFTFFRHLQIVSLFRHLQIVTTNNYSALTNSQTLQFTAARTNSSQSAVSSSVDIPGVTPLQAGGHLISNSYSSKCHLKTPYHYIASARTA